ncbi:hypothetical protein COW36_02595 [bacterium (Candidatus Blackallbacteria) CG17_big_fil_post_rev_8_21_14_2_50_48_46]|uniref:Uncharacterized protein n=1 Tax=bacterium (Candidatus Blackallbacteria) CG17_big_fil_post_rev_8_21_14_2_50_48_46 TaxID=2014261 RepID=A0A2M7GAS2_9BACT|nr:MAG: hypothetical protein COW64_12875 [bacterium (Candidatus Blackallbacteria) CG18_big_fil_WC_8_21_14_2_50_49_26]PIW19017.1 MAG: hypothetical protein COW36_02595 [bacterium (Candidatus Blackallbacteria) CG17_big_fil_post_rev_8_21_14_2_50_48_46]PIW44615.1 MAG: hypothetical protein COW20_23520 [bacterium (Candidatus Blackallbacteria) CG13_big_fil_rev_8_21_14_2_50_49_14]
MIRLLYFNRCAPEAAQTPSLEKQAALKTQPLWGCLGWLESGKVYPTSKADISAPTRKKIPMGGTSAGLAILGEVIYSAEGESMQSEQVLNNPFHPELTLRNDFIKLPLMQNLLTDSHFAERNRQGRLLAFLARARSKRGPVN